MPIKFDDNYKELLRNYQEKPDKFIFFTGAGMSAPLFPLWSKVLNALLDRCISRGQVMFDEKELRDYLNLGKYYIEIANLLSNSLSKIDYREFLEEIFDKDFNDADIPEAYAKLFEIAPQVIITTNYDSIPNVLADRRSNIYTNRQIAEALRSINGGKKTIIKLHGDIRDQESIVFTSDNYNAIYNNLAFNNALETILSAYNVIFIGFSITDPYLSFILNRLNSIKRGLGITHYALLPNITSFQGYLFERDYSVKPIAFKPSNNNFPEVVIFLNSLVNSVFTSALTPEYINHQNLIYYSYDNKGIIKISDTNEDRIFDYKNCLLEAEGVCFISGTSMIHLSEDSSDLLLKKLEKGTVYLLLLDPDWANKHYELLTFLDNEDDKKDFCFEIKNSIRKLKALKRTLPHELANKFKIKVYQTIFPYIVTGYDQGDYGKMVVEITDYIPEKTRPRFTLHKIENANSLYSQVKNKFFSLWANATLTKEI